MKTLLSALAIIFFQVNHAHGQNSDSVKADDSFQKLNQKIETLEHKVDSLEKLVRSSAVLQSEIPIEGLMLEDLPIEEGEKRSRRRRLDTLLQDILERPGRLNFNGNATAGLQWLPQEDGMTVAAGSFDLFCLYTAGKNRDRVFRS